MSQLKYSARFGTFRSLLACGASVLAFTGPLWASCAFAQETDQPVATGGETAEDEEAIIVTGVRRALQNAQDIKRNAETIVDSITATDIGAFPDRSVAEALQRVPGITVSRFAATSDTTHFSAEPSSVLVRGLPQVRSEFNGRDSFNANSSRGLSFGDVSPELMAGVDTFKNQTADMIEGGIAGTVNLRTRLPFDQAGSLVALSADAFYGDLSDAYTPSISGIIADRWETRIGEFGLMANAAWSRVITTSEGVQIGRFFRTEDVPEYGGGTKWFPGGIDIRSTRYDRERTGFAFAAQWESPDDTLLATIQFNRSDYSNDFEEFSLTAGVGASQSPQNLVTGPIGFRPEGAPAFEFDSNGVFMRGVIADTGGGNPTDPNATNPNNNNFVYQHPNGFGPNSIWFCSPDFGITCPATRGIALSADTRFSDGESLTQDLSFNLRWEPTERLGFNFDVQYIDSEVTQFDNSTNAKTFADVALDLTGEHPRFEFRESAGYPLTDGGFSDPRNYFHEWEMEHLEDSSGNELAIRADAEYQIDSGWLDSLRVGVRRAEREQDINWSTFNWGAVAPLWGVPAGVGFFLTQAPWNGQSSQLHDLGPDILGGGVFDGGVFVHPNLDVVRDYQRTIDTFAGNSLLWVPLSQRGCIAEPGTSFCPVEQQKVQEDTSAAYVMLRFGGADSYIGGMEVRGNIGVRYVETEVAALGGVLFPSFNFDTTSCPPPPQHTPATDERCLTPVDDIAFATFSGDAAPQTLGATHEHWLPSFNLRLGLTDEMYLRFAASRALARPDMGLYKNFINIGMDEPNCTNVVYQNPPCAPGSTPTGTPDSFTPTYSADAGNPQLAPTTADQFDVTYEWYFSDVGLFTAAVFYKKFYDYIQFANYTREFTNNGVTRTVSINGPVNGEGAEMQGVEVGFQTFFDFLPAPWDGFGIQANLTYVDNQGITNANLSNVSDGQGGTGQDPNITFTNLPLEGLSDWAYNIVGMYEKGDWALRLAYNWRSEYLASQADCCIKLPIWAEDYGQLDGSIRYRLADRLELSLQGQNLLNSETELTQQVTEDGMRLPRSWFINDRRLQLGLRYKM